MRKSTFVRNGTKFMLFLNAFMVEAIFRERAFDNKSIDLQVVLKMGLWVITFLYCMAFFKLWGKKLLRIDNIFEVLLLALIGISCFYAPNFAYSAASAFSLVAVLAILLMSSSVLSNREIMRQLIFGCTAVMAISIVVYFAVPSFGRMADWQHGELVEGNRLSGITGTANACGYISALCLLALYYYRQYQPRKFGIYWGFVLINLVALYMSNSRTAMAALVISISIAGIIRATPAKLAVVFLGICVAILGSALVDFNSVFAMLARSGEASEITSGTGRTAIWAIVEHMISLRPVFGWGYAASNTLLLNQTANIGFVATHAHNAFLQIAFSVGYVGLTLFILLMATKIYFSFRSREPLNIAFIFFLLIDGITEPIAFQGVATTTTLALATVLALNYRNADQMKEANETFDPAYQQRLSRPAPA